ncbi:MAG: hypothetical protein QM601_03885 [Pseudoxanthomonas sp.]
MTVRYHIRLPDPRRAHGAEPAFSFHDASGPDAFAEQLQDALRTGGLFERWRQTQDDPDAVDPVLGTVDPGARVHGEVQDLHIDLVAETTLPGDVLRHRLRLLAGNGWELRDVSPA